MRSTSTSANMPQVFITSPAWMETGHTRARSSWYIKAVLSIMLLASTLKASAVTGDSVLVLGTNGIRGELFGSGLYYSISYERILKQTPRWAIASRIGGAYLREPASELTGWNSEDDYIVTFCNSFLFGHSRSKFEAGIALTFFRADVNLHNAEYEPGSSSTNLLAG